MIKNTLSRDVTKSNLILAKSLIENTQNWTREVYARDSGGVQCSSTSEKACRFCAIGALQKARSFNTKEDASKDRSGTFLINACRILFDNGITYVNDSLGHEAILQAFDSAINDLKEIKYVL